MDGVLSGQNIGRAVSGAHPSFNNTAGFCRQLTCKSLRKSVRQRYVTAFKRSNVLRTDTHPLGQFPLSQSTHDSQIPQVLLLALDDDYITDLDSQHLGASRECINTGIGRAELPLRVCRCANATSSRDFGTAKTGGSSSRPQASRLEAAEPSFHR